MHVLKVLSECANVLLLSWCPMFLSHTLIPVRPASNPIEYFSYKLFALIHLFYAVFGDVSLRRIIKVYFSRKTERTIIFIFNATTGYGGRGYKYRIS